MAHAFFQQFGINPQSNQPSEEEIKYDYNCLVFEISNNWPFVRWMMDKYRNGRLKQVDHLEQVWYNFIVGNGVDVEKYEKKSDKFVQEYIKK